MSIPIQRIQSLPLHLANQIAAGEVIERPASVIKELLENSVDAGATHIHIDIESAGNQLIRVRDNGNGIHPDDLPLALSRHATSKLHSSEQLSTIATLGFRGEALPSISSISRLTLGSRQPGTDCGWQINGLSNEIEPIAQAVGTVIEVRELFFNLPARKRFLRGNKTEQTHILTTIQRIALSRFDIGFNCQFSAHSQLKLPAISNPEKRIQRISKICGKSFVNNALYIEQTLDEISLTGWLGTAQGHRAQTDIQFFYINGRVIRDRVINHAIRQAYSEQIPAGRHPAYVLYLSIPLDRVDINVHPTKHEVRFRDARLIHGLLTRVIQEALSLNTVITALPPSLSDSTSTIPAIAEQGHFYQSKPDTADNTLQNLPHMDTFAGSRFGRPVSVLYQRYLLTQTHGDWWLIDLQLADQTRRRQQFNDALNSNTLVSRPILVPIKITVSSQQADLIAQHTDKLAHFGVQLQLQNDVLVVQSIPSLLAQTDIKIIIESILAALTQKHHNDEDFVQALLQQLPDIAYTSLEQANQLLLQLPVADDKSPWCCRLDKASINSLF